MKNNKKKESNSLHMKKTENQGPRSKKRERKGHSNETHPSKRPQNSKQDSVELQKVAQTKPKGKFLYEEIGKEATEITIIRKNSYHISLLEWYKVWVVVFFAV
uniref:Uncharacterized protein n=1 Tax=Lepeophtheirus salmonis TaxID=72036 RepID=A0A0K2VCF5_LEPSM